MSEFVALYLMWKDLHTEVDLVCDDIVWDKLEKAGWMKRFGTEFKDWTVRSKFIQLVSTDKDQMWAEFCSHMPFKVPDGRGGNRILRAKDPEAGTNEKCKKLYLGVVKNNPTLHKKIIKCLEMQLKEMRNSLQFLQNTETWIRQRTWEKYEHLVLESTSEEEKSEGYGTQII